MTKRFVVSHLSPGENSGAGRVFHKAPDSFWVTDRAYAHKDVARFANLTDAAVYAQRLNAKHGPWPA